MTLEQSTYFFTNADYHHGSGQGDWGAGVGLLYVYVDDLDYPVLITMLNIEDTLHLDNGRAFVGFTAGTGDNNWQAHDVLSWQFRSLWQNRPYTRPSVVNGEGAFECINEEKCVHRPDLDHYYRSNRLVEGSAVDTFADFISDF